MLPLRVLPLYILRPSNPSPPPKKKPFRSDFLPLFSPLQTNCLVIIIIISLDNVGWLSVPQVKAILPRRGQKFKSSAYSQTFGESGQHHLAVLLYLWHFRQSTCDKKEKEKKKSGLRGFLDVQGYNTGYWCRLEVISVLPGVTWFSVPLQRTHIKPHTSSGGVMALLPTDETLKKHYVIMYLIYFWTIISHIFAPLSGNESIYCPAPTISPQRTEQWASSLLSH